MAITTPPEQTMALELERLRGTCIAGFTEIKGSLAVLAERSNRTEQDIRQLRTDYETDTAALRAEVERLKSSRWPLPSVAALTALTALAITIYGLTAH